MGGTEMMEMSYEKLLAALESAGNQGSDLSPGDPVQRNAAWLLRMLRRDSDEIEQICGQALGYPWYKDDQANFPGATTDNGVCIGEHVSVTIVAELANAYKALKRNAG
jgi:hypothetical protein